MHESHWPSNLAWLLSLCTCIPNLDEIEQFLEQLEHGNQSVTDGQTDRGKEGQRDRGTDEPKLISPVFFKKRVTIKALYEHHKKINHILRQCCLHRGFVINQTFMCILHFMCPNYSTYLSYNCIQSFLPEIYILGIIFIR